MTSRSDKPETVDAITGRTEYAQQVRAAIDDARGSVEAEGFVIDPEVLAYAERVADGRWTVAEFVKFVLGRHARRP